MMRIIYIFIVLLVFMLDSLGAQKICRDVIGSAGGSGMIGSSGVKIRCTVAQPPLAGTASNASNFLRQGFQQPQKAACSNAPQALFSVTEENSGDCGVVYHFNYDDLAQNDTEFSWDFGADAIPTSSNQSNPQNITFANAGTFSITLTVTTGGCIHTSSQDVEVTQSAAFALSTEVTTALCFNDGAIILMPVGGTAPFEFNWSNGSTNAIIEDLTAGLYSYTVTDADNCELIGEMEVTGNDSLALQVSVKDESCTGTADGTINLTVLGGVEPYIFSWSNGGTSEDLVDVESDTYEVVVTDSVGCMQILANIDVAIGCTDMTIPDILTPNNDGSNDEWVIPGIDGYPENRLEIYNRWGHLVFDIDGYDNTWQGTNNANELLPAGAYYYVLELNDPENTTIKGSITILR